MTTTHQAPHFGVRTAGFLSDPPLDEQVQQMYETDLRQQGYVAHLTRVWAHSPEALAVLSYVLKRASDKAELDPRRRSLLVTATASAMGDSYCATAFGLKLAVEDSAAVAAAVIGGSDRGLDAHDRALATWARRVVDDPSAVTAGQVEELRAVGYDDDQIFALTLYVALRMAFSTVNDALGATPDLELVRRAPEAVRAAVTFGRPA